MRAARGPTLSLRHLLILLTAIGLLPLALLGIWSIQTTAQHRLREQERGLLDLARALSSAVDAELDGTVAALSSSVRSPELQAGDVRAFHAVARQLVQSQPEWLGMVLTDDNGRLLFRTTAPFGAPGGSIVDPASVQQALVLRRPIIGRITRGPGGRAAIPVRIPVTDRNGRLYTLTAVVQPTRILRVIERQQVPADSIISVFDATRTRVARSIEQDRTVASAPGPTLSALFQRGGVESAGVTTTLEGRHVVTAYTSVSRYGWTVAVGASPAASPAGYLLVGAGLAGSLAFCIALASWLARRIVRRIDDLAADAAALGAGRPVRAAQSRIREIDGMAQALEAAARQRQADELERSSLLGSLEQAVRSQEDALGQAREAGRAKDAFLAVLGHELRNPLSPIVSSLDLMDMRDDPSSARERAIMRRQVSHLKRLVDDLLDVSRIVSGKLQLDLQPLDLAATLRHALAALPDQQIALSAPSPTWVMGDESRLTQVLHNLLSNAARFGSDSTRLGLTSADGQARLSVRDNGAGISPEHLPHIFAPFFQAPQSMARHTGGLGLGLAIVHKIVELHGGRITASSSGPGQGSVFELTLPLAAPAPRSVVPAPAAAGRPQRVLVVDDNEDAATLTASLLARMGHTTRVAHTGARALASAAEFAPDAAILDIGLPDMDGYALAPALRAQAGGRALHLVALTGYGQRTDVARAAEAGFDVHLTKPASIDDLQRALEPARAAR